MSNPFDTIDLRLINIENLLLSLSTKSPDPTATPPEELIDRRGAAKLFDVSLPTLDNWTRDGIIVGYRIGAHIRYKRSELLLSLKEIQSVKQTARR